MKLQLLIYSVVLSSSFIKAKSILDPDYKPQKQFQAYYKNLQTPEDHEYENQAQEEKDDLVVISNDNDNFEQNMEMPLPAYVNWVDRKAITKVRNQHKENCIAIGWAFVATDVVEAQRYIQHKTSEVVELSAQELVDCTSNIGNLDCNVEFDIKKAFNYISENGILPEKSYPDKEMPSDECLKNSENTIAKGARIKFKTIHSKYTGRIKKYLDLWVNGGPLVATIDASEPEFIEYKGGLYKKESCSTYKQPHNVLIVGYNATNDSEAYWIVKNSWGENWGENGYIRIQMDTIEPDCILKKFAYVEIKFV